MSYKSKLHLLAMTSILMGMESNNERYSNVTAKNIDVKPKDKVIPKGCELYTFKESFGTLEVVATSRKSAMKKYNSWCDKNNDNFK